MKEMFFTVLIAAVLAMYFMPAPKAHAAAPAPARIEITAPALW